MPHYDLDIVRELAKRKAIEYRGPKVRLNIAVLGYDLNDVADCITQLTCRDFHKSTKYKSGEFDDIYKCIYTKTNNEETVKDELFIKLSLYKDCLTIDLGSFHQ